MNETEVIYPKLEICNSANDFEHSLRAYDFLLASTVLCAEDGADKKLFKAIKLRRDEANNWSVDKKQNEALLAGIEIKCNLAGSYAVKNVKDDFRSIGRMVLLTLNAAFEKRIKDMLYIWYAAEVNDFEIKETFNLTKIQQKLVKQKADTHWHTSSGWEKDWEDLKYMLIQLATDMHFKLKVSGKQLLYWKKYTDVNKYETEVINKITDECWIEIKDAYLLRNAITHNRNKSTQQITIRRQTFGFNDYIDPEQSSINSIISSFRKIHELFPQSPDSIWC
jgi:hypothetical protein